MVKNKVRLRLYKDADFEFLHELLSDEATKKIFSIHVYDRKRANFFKIEN